MNRMENRSVRIAALDDHSIIRAVFRTIAEDAHDMELAWTASTIAEARSHIQIEVPDLMLVDVSLPDGEGYDFITEALKLRPKLLTLMVSMHDEPVYAQRAYDVGARGYVVKNISPRELLKVMHSILEGEMHFIPKVQMTGQGAAPRS